MSVIAIHRMGRRGDGVGEHAGRQIHVARVLPGETVKADVSGGRGVLREIVTASRERVAPPCRHFEACGGCQLQHWQEAASRRWKRQLVVDQLAQRGLGEAPVGELVDAHGRGRRRVTITVQDGRAGFRAARSHAHVRIDRCLVLVPQLDAAMTIAEELAAALGRGTLRVCLLYTDTGIDCAVMDVDDPDLDARMQLAQVAEQRDLARLSAADEVLIERRRPVLRAGTAMVTPPAGGFAQATQAGEAELAAAVASALEGHASVADLFCGWGAFTLRLAQGARVLAVDSDVAALAALTDSVRATQGLKPVEARARDLMREPLGGPELDGVTAVVFDPPRAGARAQAEALAGQTSVRTVVAVSCDAGTFARDAAILSGGGFRLASVTPVDQFAYSAHVEIVGVFNR